MNNEEGNLTVEASLVMPIFILYFLLVITIGIFIFENGLSRINSYKNDISNYEPKLPDRDLDIELKR